MAIEVKKAWMIGVALSVITIGGQIVGYSLTAGQSIGELRTNVTAAGERVRAVEAKEEKVEERVAKHLEDQARTEERYVALLNQYKDMKDQLARIERKLDAKK